MIVQYNIDLLHDDGTIETISIPSDKYQVLFSSTLGQGGWLQWKHKEIVDQEYKQRRAEQDRRQQMRDDYYNTPG